MKTVEDSSTTGLEKSECKLLTREERVQLLYYFQVLVGSEYATVLTGPCASAKFTLRLHSVAVLTRREDGEERRHASVS